MQDEVIPDQRFITPGLRNEGGFIGSHDRITGMPLPEHISATPKDLDSLMGGMMEWRPSVKNSLVMPDNKVDLLIRLLVQNGGRLSKRAIGKEFSGLTENERQAIEARYLEIYSG